MGRSETEERDGVLGEVRRFLAEQHGIQLIGALGFENTYALAMRRSHADRLGIRKISDLSVHAAELEMGADIEFFSRTEWKALRRVYGLDFGETRSMDPGLMYQAAEVGEVDVISAFSTDGRIAAYDLAVLEDDRGVIPPYDAILLASPRLHREEPELLDALATLQGRLDEERMRRANLDVDLEGRSPAEAAATWLEELSSRESGNESRD